MRNQGEQSSWQWVPIYGTTVPMNNDNETECGSCGKPCTNPGESPHFDEAVRVCSTCHNDAAYQAFVDEYGQAAADRIEARS